LYEGHLDNKNLYNDKELIDEGDLDSYDFGFRIYDPQIGRFTQIDPLTDGMPYFGTYLFAGNEPIGNIDFEGLNPIPGLSGTWANLGDVVVKTAPKAVVQTGAKVGAAAVGTLLKSSIKAPISLVNSALTGGSEFNKGVVQGIGEWGLDIINSGVNTLSLYYNLATKPEQTISGLKGGLLGGVNSLLNEGGKIANGDFSSITNELDNFAKKGARDHGKFAGKIGAEAAVAAITAGGGSVGRVSAKAVGNLKNVKLITGNLLKKQGLDAHAIKTEFLGVKNISKYDLYKHSNTGEILIFGKGGKGTPISTGYFIK
jgi:RHS repeat-associated protein